MKVVINACYGGFSLSDAAVKLLGISSAYDLKYSDRSDPNLIRIVEDLGEASYGRYAELKIIEIPDGVNYTIEEYDGLEHVAEVHRTWS